MDTKQTRLLGGLIRIYSGESVRLVHFLLLGVLLQTSISIGMTVTDALFLARHGASALPTFYLISPLVIILFVFGNSIVLARIGIERTLFTTLLGIALIVVALATSTKYPSAVPYWFSEQLYYLAKLSALLTFVSLYTLYWNAADSYFTILEAKRLYAYLSGACAVGAALGGALVHLLSETMRVEDMLLFWAASLLIAVPAVARIQNKCTSLEASTSLATGRSLTEELKILGSSFTHSTFSIAITACLFVTLLVSLLCEYQFYGILSAGRTESELASLLGKLNCYTSVFNFLTTIFLFNVLVERIGVRNLALVQSLAYIVVFSLLLIEQSNFAAILGYFVYHGLFISIDGNNFNLLLNALPSRYRKQLRTCIEGACEPLAYATIGVGLVGIATYLSPAHISGIGLLLSLAAFGFALLVRSRYLGAMVENIRTHWLDLARPTRLDPLATSKGSLTSFHAQPLLVEASRSSLSKRRLIEQYLTALDSRAVPSCVRVLANERLPLVSRSIAARVLSRVSFPQLESMEAHLTQQSIRLTYNTILWREAIRASQLSESSKLVGSRLFSDKQQQLIEFLLELLNLTGRLTHFEPLVASLASNDQKSRDTAIEAIEQSCNQNLRQALRPILDKRESEKLLPYAHEILGLPALELVPALIDLCTNADAHDIEQAIALELLSELQNESARELSSSLSARSVGEWTQTVATRLLSHQSEERLIDSLALLCRLPATSQLGLYQLTVLYKAQASHESNEVSPEQASVPRLLEIADINSRSNSTTMRFHIDQLLAQSNEDPRLARSLYCILRSQHHATA